MGDEKSTKDRAEKLVSKKLANAIADKMLEIKKHEAKIKVLKKDIDKIISGELVPDCDDDESSYHFPKFNMNKFKENLKKINPYEGVFPSQGFPRYRCKNGNK